MSEKPTPRRIYNRPGLSTLERRVGKVGAFRESQLLSLSDTHRPGLQPLTTRDPEDLSIAMLDAWAAVGDILTFYQERVSNESYLETAKERFSLRQIGALVDYRPTPPTAAMVNLAFEVDDALPTDDVLHFERGIAVQNIPIDPVVPQTFETVEPFRGHARWNSVRPVTERLQVLERQTRELHVRAEAQRPRRGQPFAIMNTSGNLIQMDAAPIRLIAHAHDVADTESIGRVRVALTGEAATDVSLQPITLPEAESMEELSKDDMSGFIDQLFERSWSRAQIQTAIDHYGITTRELRAMIYAVAEEISEARPKLLTFSVRARLFGHNALRTSVSDFVDPCSIASAQVVLSGGDEPPSGQAYIYLDRKYEDVVTGDHIVIRGTASGTRREVTTRILGASVVSVSGYGQSGEVTRIAVQNSSALKLSTLMLRSVEVYTATSEVPLAPLPITDPIGPAGEMMCDDVLLDLAVGQKLILQAERADLPGVPTTISLRITEIRLSGPYTKILFDTAFSYPLLRSTLHFNANVALASHGETVSEILGSGNGAVSGQRFALRKAPLTYLPAETETGRAAELRVHVEASEWEHVPSFATSSSDHRAYTIEVGVDGQTYVRFGDGLNGLRLPTGENNIHVEYRVGAGTLGQVGADQITLMLRKPLGISSVTNPMPTFGGSSGETPEMIRESIPNSSTTLGRIVSLRDYEHFARQFAGVAKAHVSWGWHSEARAVHLTVAGEGGQILSATEGALPKLVAQIRRVDSPGARVFVNNYVPVLAEADVRVFYEAGYDPDERAERIYDRVLAEFGFDSRAIGEPLRASKLMASIQSVEGVRAVDLDRLYRQDSEPDMVPILRARRHSRGDRAGPRGAELITIARETLRLEAVL